MSRRRDQEFILSIYKIIILRFKAMFDCCLGMARHSFQASDFRLLEVRIAGLGQACLVGHDPNSP